MTERGLEHGGGREWDVCWLSDVPEPGACEFRVGDEVWPFRGVIIRWQGEVHAYANVCPHLQHPLNLDPERFFDRDQSLLVCASHGALFDPGSGECVAGPCAGDSLQRLQCRVDADRVYVIAPQRQA